MPSAKADGVNRPRGVADGKLYLNYKGVQKWEQDVPGNVNKADRNWPDLHK